MPKSEGVCVVAACFNEEDVITRFVERVLAVPGVDQLVLIDDGSSDARWNASAPGCRLMPVRL